MVYLWVAVNAILCMQLECHWCWLKIRRGSKHSEKYCVKDLVWVEEMSGWTSAAWYSCAACLQQKGMQFDRICIFLRPPDFDPNLGMMAGITPMNPMMPGLGMVPAPVSQDVPVIKEIIHCKSCTLFPPNPSKSECHTDSAWATSRGSAFTRISSKRFLHHWELYFIENLKANSLTKQFSTQNPVKGSS